MSVDEIQGLQQQIVELCRGVKYRVMILVYLKWEIEDGIFGETG